MIILIVPGNIECTNVDNKNERESVVNLNPKQRPNFSIGFVNDGPSMLPTVVDVGDELQLKPGDRIKSIKINISDLEEEEQLQVIDLCKFYPVECVVIRNQSIFEYIGKGNSPSENIEKTMANAEVSTTDKNIKHSRIITDVNNLEKSTNYVKVLKKNNAEVIELHIDENLKRLPSNELKVLKKQNKNEVVLISEFIKQNAIDISQENLKKPISKADYAYDNACFLDNERQSVAKQRPSLSSQPDFIIIDGDMEHFKGGSLVLKDGNNKYRSNLNLNDRVKINEIKVAEIHRTSASDLEVNIPSASREVLVNDVASLPEVPLAYKVSGAAIGQESSSRASEAGETSSLIKDVTKVKGGRLSPCMESKSPEKRQWHSSLDGESFEIIDSTDEIDSRDYKTLEIIKTASTDLNTTDKTSFIKNIGFPLDNPNIQPPTEFISTPTVNIISTSTKQFEAKSFSKDFIIQVKPAMVVKCSELAANTKLRTNINNNGLEPDFEKKIVAKVSEEYLTQDKPVHPIAQILKNNKRIFNFSELQFDMIPAPEQFSSLRNRQQVDTEISPPVKTIIEIFNNAAGQQETAKNSHQFVHTKSCENKLVDLSSVESFEAIDFQELNEDYFPEEFSLTKAILKKVTSFKKESNESKYNMPSINNQIINNSEKTLNLITKQNYYKPLLEISINDNNSSPNTTNMSAEDDEAENLDPSIDNFNPIMFTAYDPNIIRVDPVALDKATIKVIPIKANYKIKEDEDIRPQIASLQLKPTKNQPEILNQIDQKTFQSALDDQHSFQKDHQKQIIYPQSENLNAEPNIVSRMFDKIANVFTNKNIKSKDEVIKIVNLNLGTVEKNVDKEILVELPNNISQIDQLKSKKLSGILSALEKEIDIAEVLSETNNNNSIFVNSILSHENSQDKLTKDVTIGFTIGDHTNSLKQANVSPTIDHFDPLTEKDFLIDDDDLRKEIFGDYLNYLKEYDHNNFEEGDTDEVVPSPTDSEEPVEEFFLGMATETLPPLFNCQKSPLFYDIKMDSLGEISPQGTSEESKESSEKSPGSPRSKGSETDFFAEDQLEMVTQDQIVHGNARDKGTAIVDIMPINQTSELQSIMLHNKSGKKEIKNGNHDPGALFNGIK